jgi:outer membrane protein
MKISKSVVIAMIALVIAATSLVSSLCNQQKVVYVDLYKLLNSYEFKKQQEQQQQAQLVVFKNAMDSLKKEFFTATAAPVKEKLAGTIQQVEYNMNAYLEQSNEKINKAVWDKLNPIVDEFGKKQNYELIMGANGMGTILYGKEKVDITNDLIRFVNEK